MTVLPEARPIPSGLRQWRVLTARLVAPSWRNGELAVGVAVSAAVRGDGLQKALQVDTFLAKPLDVDKLLAIAATHCPRNPGAGGRT